MKKDKEKITAKMDWLSNQIGEAAHCFVSGIYELPVIKKKQTYSINMNINPIKIVLLIFISGIFLSCKGQEKAESKII
jgi:hypothetical protein